MGWTSMRVRPATTDDLPALLDFGDELREQLGPTGEGGRVRTGAVATRPNLASRYTDAIADPERHLVVAVCDDDIPLGMAVFLVAPANALLDRPALHVSHAVVAARHKRRGVGKALVSAAAAYADERGLDQLVVSVNPGSRDANRFFARLGFAPLAVRRVAPVAVVRRRLQALEVRPLDLAVHRRPRRPRRLRSGAAALPLGPAEDS